MQSSYQIDDENIIHATFPGEFTANEIITHSNTVHSDPKFHKGMNTIADITNAIFDWNYWDVESLRNYVKSIEEIRGECKWAVVVCKRGITYAVARVFIVIYEAFSPNIEVRLFNNKEDGLKWLKT